MKRKKFQGVLNILSFNRHFYFIGITILLIILLSRQFLDWNETIFLITILAFGYGLLMPLIVSIYVYDFSDYYHFQWLQKLVPGKADRIVNINAGFDETSFILQQKFPQATLEVLDFYNPTYHTEPAIVRARKVSLVFPGTRKTATDSVPVKDQTADIVFLLSAAHEIRSHEDKIMFLTECRRICKPGGQLIMVEHLRDFPNFLAFTVGFTHFFSARLWKRVLKQAGFENCNEIKFTPFMSVFNCKC